MRVVTVPAGNLIGFKALPTWEPSIAEPAHFENADWAGMYPQLTVANAVHYLPNWWERGQSQASIVALTNKQEMKFLVSKNTLMTDGKVNDAAKAAAIREEVQATLGHKIEGPLVLGLGSLGYGLILLDADDYEVVVPHNLLHELNEDILFKFEASKHHAATTEHVVGHNIDKHIVEDPTALGDALQAIAEVKECAFLKQQVQQE